MKGKSGRDLAQSRDRSGIYLGLLCVTVLVLMGCGAGREPPRPLDAGSSALPHSIKGYELYSWQPAKEWQFTLITGTNRLKGSEEIVSIENVVTETGWVKLSVQGTENLMAVLNRLPEGETVTWNSDRWLERVGVPKGEIQLPAAELLEEIESYCRRMGIQLQVAG